MSRSTTIIRYSVAGAVVVIVVLAFLGVRTMRGRSGHGGSAPPPADTSPWVVERYSPRSGIAATPVHAPDSALVAAFAPRQALLDSIAHVFTSGPAPALVSADSGATLPNRADPRIADRRVRTLQAMLTRAGAISVFRDARYPHCTFVTLAPSSAHTTGFLHAPEGCRVPAPNPRSFRDLVPVAPGWYAYRFE